MADFPSFQDLFLIARNEMLSRNTDLTQEVIDREGTDANALTAASASVGDECIGRLTNAQAGLLLDSSSGSKLDRLVYDPRYGSLVRFAASPAQGEVQFTTTAPAPVAFTIPANTRIATADGIEYFTLTDVTFPLFSTGPISVFVQSALSGLSQRAKAGTITSLISTLAGAPSDLKVTNALATQGSADEEKDDDLRNRARLYYKTSRRGTLNAIEQGALAVAGIKRAVAFEPVDGNGYASRIVKLAVTDEFTEKYVEVSPTPSGYQASTGSLNVAIQGALYDVRAAGIQVICEFAVITLLGVNLSLTYRSGLTQDAIAATAMKARVQVVEYINGLAPGAPFVYSDAQARIKSVSGLDYKGNEIVSPVGNVQPKQLEALRSYLGLVLVVASN